MTKPVYLETWEASDFLCAYGDRLRKPDRRTRLAASAPALVRALLAVDAHIGRELSDDPAQCEPGCEIGDLNDVVDAALTAAGFDSQASRDEARRRIAANE